MKPANIVNNKQNIKVMLLAFFIICLTLVNAGNAFAGEKIFNGMGRFIFTDTKGDPKKPIPVWYYKPSKFSANSPILFVITGVTRNAQRTMKPWLSFADKHGILVVTPDFPKKYYPGSRSFQTGNILNKSKKRNPENKWTFSTIEHLFDYLKDATGNKTPKYYIFGHSAGGQFVHRFVIFKPDARIKKAMAANAGWYTVTDFDVKFPYGLKRSPATIESLKKSFGNKLVILLGDKDTDTNHKYLNRSKRAMKQGPHRFARGKFFYNEAWKEAKKLNTPINWKMRIVPGAAHSNSKMEKEAEKLFFE